METADVEYCADGPSRLGSKRIGVPLIVADPDVGDTSPRSIRNVVVLPEPFGPRNPVIEPA